MALEQPQQHAHSIDDLPMGMGPGKIPTYDMLFPPPQSSSGANLDILSLTQFVAVDTTDFEPLLFLSAVGSGPDGRRVTIRIIAGTLSAIVNPRSLAEGVDGPPGSIYEIDALEESATFQADIANATWWKV